MYIRLDRRCLPTKSLDKEKRETLLNCRLVHIERPSTHWPAWRHVWLLLSQSHCFVDFEENRIDKYLNLSLHEKPRYT